MARTTDSDNGSPKGGKQHGAGWRIKLRYWLVAAMLGFFAFMIVRSAYNTTVVHVDDWNAKANRYLERIDTILPERGDILACDGSVLATNLTYYTLRMDFGSSRFMKKEFLESLDSLCDTLAANYPHYTRKEWKKRLEAQVNVPDSVRSRRHNFTLLRNLSHAQVQAVKKYPFFRRSPNRNRTGLTVEGRARRCYPYGDMARLSVGFVSERPDGQVHGGAGLEYALDSLLYGTPGTARHVPLTRAITNWVDVPPVPGYTLTTTIDVGMQDIVENELNNMLVTTEADWGTAILMEVATGDIKAISNLERDTISGKYIEAMNRALQGFEPGSVMKTISMVVALEDGFVTNLEQTYPIGHSFVYGGGSPIRDSHSPAYLPVSRFLEYSSNIGMTKLVAPHFAHDPNAFRERLRQLGFLDRFHTGIAGETTPYFPPLDLKAGGLVSLGRQTYGYASRIPPLYMCAFYNAVANDGRFVRPRIVSRISRNGVDSILPVTYVRDSICSPRHARQVRQMLHEVVYGQGGTAKMLKSDIVEIAGKTGTAKLTYEDLRRPGTPRDTTKKVPTGYMEGRYRLAFCGFFPYEHPKYTCMVLISRPAPQYRGAGYTSGMVLKNIALSMYSRGLLDNASDFRTDAEAPLATVPMVHANADSRRTKALGRMLGTKTMHTTRTPAKIDGGVPDVLGLSVRDAVNAVETAGYNVNVIGTGYVTAQNPPAGTRAKRGTRVVLALKH